MSDDEPPVFQFPDDWPEEMREQRAMLWAAVNWLLPIRVVPELVVSDEPPPEQADFLALKPQLLPRVPIAGERLEIADHYATAESVSWASDGRVVVRLRRADVQTEYLDKLRADGWTVFPRRDADTWLGSLG